MSSENNHEQPIPYYENELPAKIRLFGDAASLLLDTYGKPETVDDKHHVEIVTWANPEIATTYELVRFHPDTQVDARVRDLLELYVTESYPNGERSVAVHSINPTTLKMGARFPEMTTEQKVAYEERKKRARKLSNGVSILPPRPNALSAEHEMELHLSALAQGLEALSEED